ncbi:S-layer protein [Sporosarcina sp. NCCP-2716]|uniref:S-layer homology domain-containing protein n=1 Tax=Sporosarcina sp. NCCP-2716 TaxID=2943679 RepID=UPI00203CFF37|nr:S-layer homology domain-containing protein [Sporosarcina sp. NCCP-2716]GKV69318.1 S-layer protein [Sporosarcina sp. NCCP-2716]
MKKASNYSKFVASAATATLVASAVVPAASAQEMKFTDVGDRYQEAVSYLSANDITQGISATKFGTQQSIKRVDVAVLLAKATLTTEEIESAPAAGFSDVPARAVKYVNALKAKGIVNGKTTSTFGADSAITRGEAAIMLSKAYGIEGDTASVAFGDVSSRYKEAVAALVSNKITNGKTTSRFGTTDSITRGELAIFLYKLETLDAAPATELKVDSVEAVSATQVQVKFTDAVNPATLFTDSKNGEFKDGVFTMSSVGNAPAAGTVTGMLSEDGKTLTVTTKNVVTGDYTIVVDKVKNKDGKDIAKFSQVVTIQADSKAPELVNAKRVNSSQYNVKFSEPLSSIGTVTYKDENGNTVADVDNSFQAGDAEVLFTLPAAVQAGKSVTVQIVAAKDMAGNLISPNPTTLTLTKGQPDGVAPTVTAVNQTGINQFTVKFSEELVGNPTVTVGGAAVKSVEKSEENPLVYVVTANGNLTDAATVSVSDFSDLSGQAGQTYSKVVTFTEDTEAPVVSAVNVATDDADGMQYAEITFNKGVQLKSTGSGETLVVPSVKVEGKYVKDNITYKNYSSSSDAATLKKDSENKIVRVALKDLLKTNDVEGAAYDLTYTLTGVESLSGVALAENKGALKFTRQADSTPENTTVAEVKSVLLDKDDNNKVNVTFKQKVDGATATNKANYLISGAEIEDVTLLPDKNGEQVAVLNLKAGSSTFNGERNIHISNIKALGSTKTMEPLKSTVTLKENVAPTVTTAKITGTKEITLTFSEAVKGGEKVDFELLVGGKSVATKVTANAVINEGENTAKISLDNALSTAQINEGITLKAVDTLDITDMVGNKLSVPTPILVTQ